MIHFAAKDAKNNFGRLLDTARQQPVTIDKQGRSVAVILSNEEYARLEMAEETLLALQASIARQEGFTGQENSEKFLENLPPKHARQIPLKIQELRINPRPQDYKKLKGYSLFKK